MVITFVCVNLTHALLSYRKHMLPLSSDCVFSLQVEEMRGGEARPDH